MMRYTLFGRSGLRVSELALGTATFGTAWGWGADADESRRVFDGYLEAGGNFIDSADIYQFGESERLLADLIAADRDRLVLATKFSMGAAPDADVAHTGNSRKTMMQALEASLKRLRTDRIDLYWVHMADGMTPIEEIVRAFDDLVRAGKILYAGLSDFPAWRVARAATIAELRGFAPIVGLQVEYSLAERTTERELLPMAEGLGLGVALWSPLGGGLLTGKYRKDGAEGRATKGGGPIRREEAREGLILDAVAAIAAETGANPARIAIAWVRAKAAKRATALIPILGARTRAQLDDDLGALKVTLDAEQERRLDEASAVALGFPHELLQSERFRHMITGGKQADFEGMSRIVA